jgi:hypothetical protein
MTLIATGRSSVSSRPSHTVAIPPAPSGADRVAPGRRARSASRSLGEQRRAGGARRGRASPRAASGGAGGATAACAGNARRGRTSKMRGRGGRGRPGAPAPAARGTECARRVRQRGARMPPGGASPGRVPRPRSAVHFARALRVPVPASELFAWHERPGAFERLAPPWQRVDGARERALAARRRAGPDSRPRRAAGARPALRGDRSARRARRAGRVARRAPRLRAGPAVPRRDARRAVRALDPPPRRRARGRRGEPPHRYHRLRPAVRGRGRRRRRPPRAPRARPSLRLPPRRDRRRPRPPRRRPRPRRRPAHRGRDRASGMVGSALVPFLTAGGHSVVRVGRGAPGRHARAPRRAVGPRRGASTRRRSRASTCRAPRPAPTSAAGGRPPTRTRSSARASTRRGCSPRRSPGSRGRRAPRVDVASGYYGDRGDEVLDERRAAGRGFLADVAARWEAAADPARAAGSGRPPAPRAWCSAARRARSPSCSRRSRRGWAGPTGSGRQWWERGRARRRRGGAALPGDARHARRPGEPRAPRAGAERRLRRTRSATCSAGRRCSPRRRSRCGWPSAASRPTRCSWRASAWCRGACSTPGFALRAPTVEQALRFELGR